MPGLENISQQNMHIYSFYLVVLIYFSLIWFKRLEVPSEYFPFLFRFLKLTDS